MYDSQNYVFDYNNKFRYLTYDSGRIVEFRTNSYSNLAMAYIITECMASSAY